MFSWMTLADRPFHYEITLTSIVDLSQSVQIQVPCPETSPKETMVGVRVQNMSSFTSYNVTVRGVGGGGAGRAVSRVFRTDKSGELGCSGQDLVCCSNPILFHHLIQTSQRTLQLTRQT
uniref:Fibronectin type-III domain-containing protein n=1 Tax=Biomphalaria glabrata TaxID=6526 RepID=A0A2C9KYK6_BIOGL